MRRIIIVLVLSVLLAVSACGQAKVGPSLLPFLDVNPSVTAIGMGEISAPSMDRYAFTINPGSLGLIHEDDHICLSAYPVHSKWGDVNPITFRSYTVSGNLLNGALSRNRPFSLNVGYHYNRMFIGYPITTYGNPSGTGEYAYIGDHAHTVTVALGVREFLDIGLGVAGTYFRESYEGFKADGMAFHFGMLVRVPPERFTFLWRENDHFRWILSPRFGVAWRNVGPDITYQDVDYPLDDTRHWGGALDIGVQVNSPDYKMMLLSISPAMEFQNKISHEFSKYGIEASFYEGITGRLGYIDYTDDLGYHTWGLSLDSRGLVCLVTDLFFMDSVADRNSVLWFFREKLRVLFDFARESPTNSDEKIDYYSLTLSL